MIVDEKRLGEVLQRDQLAHRACDELDTELLALVTERIEEEKRAQEEALSQEEEDGGEKKTDPVSPNQNTVTTDAKPGAEHFVVQPSLVLNNNNPPMEGRTDKQPRDSLVAGAADQSCPKKEKRSR